MELHEDRVPFLKRYWIWVTLVAFILIGIAFLVIFRKEAKPKRAASASVVNIVPPLPPLPPPTPFPTPPPPPIEEVQPEPEVVEEFIAEESAEDLPPDPAPSDDPPDDPIGTNVQGDGSSDAFGLKAGSGGTGRIGGGGAGSGGTRWGRYAAQVQSRIAEAMRAHRTTRSATLSLQVKVWADSDGKISRVELGQSTGDVELDRILREEVLGGLSLKEAPPADMPMPIVLRLQARRP